MWFINRTGQSEGPFPEQQIIQMIVSGQLTAANICPQGGQQWMPLHQHPPFAAALQGGAAGAATGGAVAAAAPAMIQPPAKAAKKKGPPLALLIGAGAALLAIVGVVLFLMLRGGGSTLSKKVPADTQIFFEVADVRGALGAAVDMEAIDTKELNAKQKIGEISEGMKDAFGISKDDAEAVLKDLESVGFAARNIRKDDRVAAVMAFGDSDGVEALLKSERFEKDGELSGGTRYLLKRDEEDDYEVIKEWSPTRKAFSMMSFDEESKEVFVWFKDAKVLAMGHKSMVEDIGGVLAGDDESLADSDKWASADLEQGAATVFVDSALISNIDDDDFDDFAKGYFRDVAPLVGVIDFVNAGIAFSAHGELKGNKISEDDAVPDAASLDIYDKLPKETVAYWAFSMKRSEDGKAAKKRMLRRMKGVDERSAERFEKSLDQLKEKLGVSLETVLDSVGEQLVVAVLADKGLEFDPEEDIKNYIDKFAVVLMYEVGDEEKAKKVVDKIRKVPFDEEPLSALYEVKKKGDGFNAIPTEEAAEKHIPAMKVRHANGHVMFALGGTALITAAAKALKGEGDNLGDDGAHEAAVDVVSNKAHVLTWMDIGRAGEVAFKYVEDNDKLAEKIGAAEKELGFSHRALRVRGDKRITAAASLQLASKGETIKWHLRTLNMPAIALVGAFSYLQKSKLRRPSYNAPTPTAGGGGKAFDVDTGSADCDKLVRRLQLCSIKKNKDYIMVMAKSSHDAYKKSIGGAKGNQAVVRAVSKTCRDGLNKFSSRYTMCE